MTDDREIGLSRLFMTEQEKAEADAAQKKRVVDMTIASEVNKATRVVRVVITDPSVPPPGRKVVFNRRAITEWGFRRNRKKAGRVIERERKRLERII